MGKGKGTGSTSGSRETKSTGKGTSRSTGRGSSRSHDTLFQGTVQSSHRQEQLRRCYEQQLQDYVPSSSSESEELQEDAWEREAARVRAEVEGADSVWQEHDAWGHADHDSGANADDDSRAGGSSSQRFRYSLIRSLIQFPVNCDSDLWRDFSQVPGT